MRQDDIKKKTYTVEDMKAAWLRGKIEGRAEAENILQERIARVCTSNNKLIKEIMRLDTNEPVAGVLIPRNLCEALIKKLRGRKTMDWHAIRIKYYMNRIDRELLKNFKKFKREVENE